MTFRQHHPRCIVLRLFLRWAHCFYWVCRLSGEHQMFDAKSRRGSQRFFHYTSNGVSCACGRQF